MVGISLYRSRSRSSSTPVSPTGEIRGPGIETYSRPDQSWVCETQIRAAHAVPGSRARPRESTLPLKTGPLPFQGVLTGFMIVDGCGAVVVLGSDRSNTAPFDRSRGLPQRRNARGYLGLGGQEG